MTLTGTGNSSSIRGGQPGRGRPADDVGHRPSPARPTTQRWYGFGNQEEIYYRVTGAAYVHGGLHGDAHGRGPSSATLVPGNVHPGGDLHDHLDRSGPHHGHGDLPVQLHAACRDLAQRRLHGRRRGSRRSRECSAAVDLHRRDQRLQHGQQTSSDAIPPEFWVTGPLLDLPDALANSNTTTGTNVAFSVSDGHHDHVPSPPRSRSRTGPSSPTSRSARRSCSRRSARTARWEWTTRRLARAATWVLPATVRPTGFGRQRRQPDAPAVRPPRTTCC
jgi:hypothetical protein